jgi:hypothetical protein
LRDQLYLRICADNSIELKLLMMYKVGFRRVSGSASSGGTGHAHELFKGGLTAALFINHGS